MHQQYSTSRKWKRKFTDVYVRPLGNAEVVVSVVSDEAMEKMEKWLTLWIHEMITN